MNKKNRRNIEINLLNLQRNQYKHHNWKNDRIHRF